MWQTSAMLKHRYFTPTQSQKKFPQWRKSGLCSCTTRHSLKEGKKTRREKQCSVDRLDAFDLVSSNPRPPPPPLCSLWVGLMQSVAETFPPHEPHHCQMFKSNMQLQCIDNPRGGITGCLGTGVHAWAARVPLRSAATNHASV